MISKVVTHQSYLSSLRRHKQLVYMARLLILLLFIFIWEYAAYTNLIDAFIFSSPTRVITTFIKMVKDKSIFIHAGITIFETIVSFFLVLVTGIGTAILLWFSRKLAEILEPYLIVLNSLPKSALAPLLIVWLGANTRTIILAGMSVAVFGTIINLYTSFKETDHEKLKLIYTLGGTKTDALCKVVIPSNIPQILSISKVNIGLALVGVIIGEFIGSKRGLGYLIIYSGQVFLLDNLIMAILVLCCVAMIFYAIINQVERCYKKRI